MIPLKPTWSRQIPPNTYILGYRKNLLLGSRIQLLLEHGSHLIPFGPFWSLDPVINLDPSCSLLSFLGPTWFLNIHIDPFLLLILLDPIDLFLVACQLSYKIQHFSYFTLNLPYFFLPINDFRFYTLFLLISLSYLLTYPTNPLPYCLNFNFLVHGNVPINCSVSDSVAGDEREKTYPMK